VLGAAVELPLADVGMREQPELGGEHDLVAPPLEGPPHQLLVGERPINFGGVDEIDAELERAMDGANRLRIIGAGAGIERRHAHAPEPDARDLQISQVSALHESSSCECRIWMRFFEGMSRRTRFRLLLSED